MLINKAFPVLPAARPGPGLTCIYLLICYFRYHLKDVIVGKIYFLLVRIKVKHMEIDIIKRETTGTGPNVYHENETIAKYEIMDGAPVRGTAGRLLSFRDCPRLLQQNPLSVHCTQGWGQYLFFNSNSNSFLESIPTSNSKFPFPCNQFQHVTDQN